MRINFFSNFNCLVKINSESFEPFDFGETLFLDEGFFAYVYPIDASRASLSYTAKFEIVNGKITTSCKNATVINFDDFCEITFNEFLINSYSAPFCLDEEKVNFNGKSYTCSVFNGGDNNITFKSNILLFSETVHNIKTSSLLQVHNLVLLNIHTEKSSHLLVINLETEQLIFNKPATKIEISTDDNKVYLLTELKDSCNHASVEVFSLNENFKLIESYPTYLTENNFFIKEISDFVFFDAIKAKNFKLARSFLTQSISGKLSDDQLLAYFSEYKEIRQTPNKNKYYLIKEGNVCNAILFEFEKQQSLISNITY